MNEKIMVWEVIEGDNGRCIGLIENVEKDCGDGEVELLKKILVLWDDDLWARRICRHPLMRDVVVEVLLARWRQREQNEEGGAGMRI